MHLKDSLWSFLVKYTVIWQSSQMFVDLLFFFRSFQKVLHQETEFYSVVTEMNLVISIMMSFIALLTSHQYCLEVTHQSWLCAVFFTALTPQGRFNVKITCNEINCLSCRSGCGIFIDRKHNKSGIRKLKSPRYLFGSITCGCNRQCFQ